MASQLRPSESGTRGVRRLLRKQLGKVVKALQGDGEPLSAEGVHEVRKRLKKLRAGLRLLREALGSRLYQQENATFRDAARPLTEVRDAEVLLQTLDKLAQHFPDEVPQQALEGVRNALRDSQREVRSRVLEGDGLQNVEESLESARERAKGWPVGRHGWSVLGAGLKRVYRTGRDAFLTAQAAPSVENLHEWRKQVKYLWLALQMLEPIQQAVLGEMAEQAHALGDHLGDDHDLAVLKQKLEGEHSTFPDREAVGVLVGLIERRRAQIQDQAWALGRALYQESPRKLAGRLGDYWSAWRANKVPEAVSQ